MEILEIIFYALVALFVLVTVHEYGHYWVARRCNVQVERFSIGFGKPLLVWNRGGTEFVLAAIPLGGYVKMYGEAAHQEDVTEETRYLSFRHKTVWQRIAIVSAGPLANLILAVVAYFLVFWGGLRGVAPIVEHVTAGSIAEQSGLPSHSEILAVDGVPVYTWSDVIDGLIKRVGESGELELEAASYILPSGPSGYEVPARLYELQIEKWLGDSDAPDLLGSLGLVPYNPEIEPLVGQVLDNSPAAAAGLSPGDRIVETDELPITEWEQWRAIVRESPGKDFNVLVSRDGQIYQLRLRPDIVDEEGGQVGLAGVAPRPPEWPEELLREREYGFVSAWAAALNKTASNSLFVLDSLGKLVSGQVSTKSLGGPVSIAKFAGASADAGWQSFLSFLAIMSVMLGVMNLLPIPILDGGHLMFYAIEVLKGSPLSDAVQGAAMRLGMSIVLGIMVLALYNDFMRL